MDKRLWFLITYEGGHSLEINGNKVSFSSSKDAKCFAKLLTEANFKNIDEVQEFLVISNMFECEDGLAKFATDIDTAIEKIPGLAHLFKWYKDFGEMMGA